MLYDAAGFALALGPAKRDHVELVESTTSRTRQRQVPTRTLLVEDRGSRERCGMSPDYRVLSLFDESRC